MSPLRSILAILTAVLFVCSTNSCAIAAAFPGAMEACCESDAAPHAGELPGSGHGADCPPCSTLESGAQLTTLIPVSLSAVTWQEDALLGALLHLQTLAAGESPRLTCAVPEQVPSPPWRDFGIKALPVRGPSLG